MAPSIHAWNWTPGLIPRLPRLAAIQAEGANPFYLAYREGFSRRFSVRAETLATAIRIGDPASFDRAVRAIRATAGVVEQVSDDEILEAKRQIDRAGFGCEPASAAALAGVRKLVAGGVIGRDDRVVAILTGNLLKDPEMARRVSAAEEQKVRLPADPGALRAYVERQLEAQAR